VRSNSSFNVDAASAGIRTELYARDPDVQEFIGRADRRRREASFDASSLLNRASSSVRVDAPYLTLALGAIVFVSLNRGARELTTFAFDSPEADVAAARVLALLGFIGLQQIVGFKPSSWLRLSPDKSGGGGGDGGDGGPRRANQGESAPDLLAPLFDLAAPRCVNPIADALRANAAALGFALLVVLPVAGLDAIGGVDLLPSFGVSGLASGDAALLTLLVAPLSEEVFFRAWLLSAFERAGGSAFNALIASSGLYALYVVPLSTVLADTTGGNGPALLLLYEVLGGFLAYLFQRSGGALPLVVVTHCAFNLGVALLAAAQQAT
jgi:membrane protease YdiL (CAAX protease family)